MKKFLIIILSVLPLLSVAQSNFQPGYMLSSKRDTISGYVDFKERSLNPTSFRFKPTKDSDVKKYDLTNSLGFGINGLATYQRFVVDISMSKEDLALLSYGLDTSSIRDTVFLKVLQDGKNVALYAYHDQLKMRYFILEKNKLIPQELRRHIYFKGESSLAVVTDNKFIEQLYAIKQKVNATTVFETRKWKQMRYVESDLLKAVADINEQEVKKSELSSTRFFVGAGFNSSKASYSGKHLFATEGASLKGSYLPFINLGIDFFVNPTIKRIIYRAELSLMRGIYNATKTSATTASSLNPSTVAVDHTFSEYTAQLNPQIIFNLYNTNKFKYFLSGGIAVNYSFYDKNVTTTHSTSVYHGSNTKVEEDAVEFSSTYFSARINTGIAINNRYEILAGYHLRPIMTRYIAYSVGVRRMSLGVNFLLGKQ